MKRYANPFLSSCGEYALTHYEKVWCKQEELAAASVRNDLSDVRHFIAWYEEHEAKLSTDGQNQNIFNPQNMTTPTLTRYRTYLQQEPVSPISFEMRRFFRGQTR